MEAREMIKIALSNHIIEGNSNDESSPLIKSDDERNPCLILIDQVMDLSETFNQITETLSTQIAKQDTSSLQEGSLLVPLDISDLLMPFIQDKYIPSELSRKPLHPDDPSSNQDQQQYQITTSLSKIDTILNEITELYSKDDEADSDNNQVWSQFSKEC